VTIAQRDRALGLGRTASTALLVSVGGILFVTLLASAGTDKLASDFDGSYLRAADLVRDGVSPYDAGWPLPYRYPPLLAEILVPLTYVPSGVGAFSGFLAAVAALYGALALVGVRDVRCYAAVTLWAPSWNALETANVTAGLALLAALTWRYRDAAWRSAGALGLAVSLKMLLWPLLVWAAASRRLKLAGLAAACAVLVTAASWGLVGFAGLSSYGGRLEEIDVDHSYSIVGMASALGLSDHVGTALMLLTGGAILWAVVHLGRKGDDSGSFTCAIGATLALTPVVWLHYLVLAVVPLGISRPRFSALWLLPIVLWVCPRNGHGDGLQPFLPAAVVLVLVGALTIRHPRPEDVAEAAP
jgi:hypothetical protein